jgi:hypothetical protein
VHELVDTLTRHLVEQRDRLGKRAGMEMLAPDQEGLQDGDTEGAAEIAQDVEQCRGRGFVADRDAGHGERGERRHHQRLAHGAHDVGQQELIAAEIGAELDQRELVPSPSPCVPADHQLDLMGSGGPAPSAGNG